MSTPGAVFAVESVRLLREVYVPRVERAVGALAEADLWWRPHARSTSVGSLLRHLEGNARQWIVSGIGGAPDHRDRASEFSRGSDEGRAALLERLGATIDDACRVLGTLQETDLLASRRIQGVSTTVMLAIYQVVEHFAWHAGQVVWIAKMRAGPAHGISFHDDSALNSARNA